MGVSEVAGRSLAIVDNDRNLTNRQFKKHCLAYEQNAWKKAFWAVEWSWSVLSAVANTSSNFEVKPLRSAATRATSSIVSYIVLFFFFSPAKISTWPDYSLASLGKMIITYIMMHIVPFLLKVVSQCS